VTAQPPAKVTVIIREVGTEDVPNNTCGYSENRGDPICGKAATVRAVANGTWEGESELTACDDHAESLRRVIGWTEPIS
jgi:hypothetical protein